MFGDHKQLPPVRKSKMKEGDPSDAFSSYMNLFDSTPMLEIQYRMNETIQEWSSSRFYQSKLKPHDSNRYRDLVNSKYDPLVGKSPVNLALHNDVSQKKTNKSEAEIITKIISSISKDSNLALDKFAVVSPHRVQAGLVYSHLFSKFGLAEGSKIVVDTVERLQGQEREVVLFTLGVDQIDQKTEEFLSDYRRLNVAVTRAKSRFYMVCSQNWANISKNNSKVAEHIKDLINWAGEKTFNLKKAG